MSITKQKAFRGYATTSQATVSKLSNKGELPVRIKPDTVNKEIYKTRKLGAKG